MRARAALGAAALLLLGASMLAARRAVSPRGRLRSGWTRVRGVKVHARSASGPEGAVPVVLVHGLGMSSLYMVPLAELLARHLPVHAPDLPGFGRSESPPRALSVAGMAEALGAWMDAAGLGGRRVALVGNSLGCEVAVAFALRYPERVARLVLQGPTPDLSVRGPLSQGLRLLLVALFEAPSLVLVAAKDYLRAGPLRFARTARHMAAHELEHRLPQVAVPVLVVRGTRDVLVPQRWAERVARLVPDGRLAVVPGAAHGMTWSHPELLAEAILPFLRGDQASRSVSSCPRRCSQRAASQNSSAQAVPTAQPASTSVGQCTPR